MQTHNNNYRGRGGGRRGRGGRGRGRGRSYYQGNFSIIIELEYINRHSG